MAMAMKRNSKRLRGKLLFIVMLTCGSALVLACATFSIHEIDEVRQGKLGEMTLAAGLIGANSTAALSFRDAQGAAETLGTLKTDRHVIAGRIYDAQGAPFAQRLRAGAHAFHIAARAAPAPA